MEYRNITLDEVGPKESVLRWLTVLSQTHSVKEPFAPTEAVQLEVLPAPVEEHYNLVIYSGTSTQMAIVPLGVRHSIHTARDKAIQVIRSVQYLCPSFFERPFECKKVYADFLRGEVRVREDLDTRYGFDVLLLRTESVQIRPELTLLREDESDRIDVSVAPRHLPLINRTRECYEDLGPIGKWAYIDETRLLTRINLHYVYGLESGLYQHVLVDYAIPQANPEVIEIFHDRLHGIRG